MCNNKSLIQIEDLEDRKLFLHLYNHNSSKKNHNNHYRYAPDSRVSIYILKCTFGIISWFNTRFGDHNIFTSRVGRIIKFNLCEFCWVIIRDHFQPVHDIKSVFWADHDGAVATRVQVVAAVLKLLTVELMQAQVSRVLILKNSERLFLRDFTYAAISNFTK